MKKTNAFVLFGRAFKNAKNDFWVSIQVLFWITIVLTIIFYWVEHTAQPQEYTNPWLAFVWAITRYIGDPGHFAGNGPITLTGRYIDTFIGILKILIFAVPAVLRKMCPKSTMTKAGNIGETAKQNRMRWERESLLYVGKVFHQ